MLHPSRLVMLLPAFVLLTAAVACGDDDAAAPGLPADPTAAAPGEPQDGAPGVYDSLIQNSQLESITVSVGTTVRWQNADAVAHTVTADEGAFDSGNLSQGDSFEHTFDEPGSFDYFCAVHPSMRGTVTVE